MQSKGFNIGRTKGYSPINIVVGHTYAGGSSGLHNFPLSISVGGGFPLANTEPIVRIYNNGTNALLAEARFNYGDDISSAAPLFDNNFVSDFQPYFQAGSQVQDGDTLAFAKKPWALATDNTNVPYDNGAIELRLELALNIGGSDTDIADINRHEANYRNFYMAAISADLALMTRYNLEEIKATELNTGDTKAINITGYNWQGLSTDTNRLVNGAPVIMAKVTEVATNDQYIAELTYDGVDDWNIALVSDPLTLNTVITIEVDTYVGREVNGRKVIFGNRSTELVCYAWDGVSKYVESSIETVANQTGWAIMINTLTGDLYVPMRWNAGTQPNRMRRFFWDGNDVTLGTSWSTNNTIASGPGDILTAGKLFQDSSKLARESKARVIGYDGVIGLTGGNIPMFYCCGGNSQGAANDLAKEVWDGVSAWVRTVIGVQFGNSSAVKSDNMMQNPYTGLIYTATTRAAQRLMEADPTTDLTRQVQAFGTFSEFVTF